MYVHVQEGTEKEIEEDVKFSRLEVVEVEFNYRIS